MLFKSRRCPKFTLSEQPSKTAESVAAIWRETIVWRRRTIAAANDDGWNAGMSVPCQGTSLRYGALEELLDNDDLFGCQRHRLHHPTGHHWQELFSLRRFRDSVGLTRSCELIDVPHDMAVHVE
jgi:hypothetical protein